MSTGQNEPRWVEPIPDGYLTALAAVVSADDRNSIPLTMWVSGGIVYGDLISWSAWKAKWTAEIAAKGTGTGVDLLANLPKSVDEALDQVLAEEGIERETHATPRFLHFKNVYLVTGSHTTSQEMSLWRCRLTDISGWSIGHPE